MSEVTNMIDFEKMTVTSAFQGKHYIVPAYQREYVWEADDAVDKFIVDIWEAFKKAPEKPFFIGSMVTYKHDNGDVELIDGQQRMTTLFVLLCSLYHYYKEEGAESVSIKQLICSTRPGSDGIDINELSVQLQYEETNEVLESIWEQTIPTDDQQKQLSPSCQRLFEAYGQLLKHIKDESESFSEVGQFVSFLLEKVLFIQIQTYDIAEALKIFETINERGEGLNPLDLLKNMVFSNVKREEFDNLNAQWKQMIDKVNEIGEKPLRFLRYYLTANYDVSSEKGKYGILPEDKIYKWISTHDDQCNYETKPFAFVGAMNDGVNAYARYLSPEPGDPGADYLRNIPMIAGKTSRLHMVLLLAAGQMDSEAKESFIKVLEVLAYYAAVNKRKSNSIEPLYAKWCGKIRSIKTKEQLKEFLVSDVVPELEMWNSEYHTNFYNLNWFTLQQYRMKYILARLTKYVDASIAGKRDYADIASYITSDVPIEHIMPQEMVDCSLYGMDEEEYEIYKKKYGNLTLLEWTINSSIKAKPFDEKIAQYPNSNYYLTASIPKVTRIGVDTAQDRMNKKLQTWAKVDLESEMMWSKWNKETIDSRQEMLYELSKEVWSIDAIVANL